MNGLSAKFFDDLLCNSFACELDDSPQQVALRQRLPGHGVIGPRAASGAEYRRKVGAIENGGVGEIRHGKDLRRQ